MVKANSNGRLCNKKRETVRAGMFSTFSSIQGWLQAFCIPSVQDREDIEVLFLHPQPLSSQGEGFGFVHSLLRA